jgi:hypothetical protein
MTESLLLNRSELRAPLGFAEGAGAGYLASLKHNQKQLSATDILALATMKNAAKCDT